MGSQGGRRRASAGLHLDRSVGRRGVEQVRLRLDAHKGDLAFVGDRGVAKLVVLGKRRVLLGRRSSAAIGSPKIQEAA